MFVGTGVVLMPIRWGVMVRTLLLGVLEAASTLAAGAAGAVGIGGFAIGTGGHPQRWGRGCRWRWRGQGNRGGWDIHPQSWGSGGRQRQ